MIIYKQYGYTPSNFAAMVLASGLKNGDFMTRYGIKRASFYLYKRGGVTMNWQQWQALRRDVEFYILKGETV